MATNYTKFCFEIKTNSIEEQEWFIKIGNLVSTLYNEEDAAKYTNLLEYKKIEKYSYLGFRIEELNNSAIVIYTEESGNIDAVAEVCKMYLKKFRYNNRYINFSWAEISYPPRIGEFGGGICVISDKEIYFTTTQKMIKDTLEPLINGHNYKLNLSN